MNETHAKLMSSSRHSKCVQLINQNQEDEAVNFSSSSCNFAFIYIKFIKIKDLFRLQIEPFYAIFLLLTCSSFCRIISSNHLLETRMESVFNMSPGRVSPIECFCYSSRFFSRSFFAKVPLRITNFNTQGFV